MSAISSRAKSLLNKLPKLNSARAIPNSCMYPPGNGEVRKLMIRAFFYLMEEFLPSWSEGRYSSGFGSQQEIEPEGHFGGSLHFTCKAHAIFFISLHTANSQNVLVGRFGLVWAALCHGLCVNITFQWQISLSSLGFNLAELCFSCTSWGFLPFFFFKETNENCD